MRIWLACLAALVACGGKLADDGDASTPPDASSDAIIIKKKKDAAPPADVSVPEAGPPDGGAVQVSNGPGFEAENQIAVAPDGTIGILWQAFGGSPYVAMQYSFSTDDGKTFTPPQSVFTPGGLYPGDPSINVDAAGNFYASYLGIKYDTMGGVSYTRVYVATSPKGAMTFGPPIEISTPNNTTDLYDHPKTFITQAGAILVGWADFPTPTAQTAAGTVARSTDGASWTRTVVTASPEVFSNLLWFCEGGAHVYLASYDVSQSAVLVALRTSTDDGATWSATPTQASLDLDEVAGLDPFCVATSSDLWVMYATTVMPATDATTLDPADHVYIAHSADFGASFDMARPDVMDHSSGMATIPAMAMDGSGKLDVAYIAGNSEGDPNGAVRFTRTSGMTVSPSAVVDGPMTFTLSRTSMAWVGDYFGEVVHGPGLYVAYPNNASGQTHIYFRKLALP